MWLRLSILIATFMIDFTSPDHALAESKIKKLSVQSEIVDRGWFSSKILVVACNRSESVGHLEVVSKSGVAAFKWAIKPGGCEVKSIKVSSGAVVGVLRAGEQATLFSMKLDGAYFWDGEAFRNALFLLLGAALSAGQEAVSRLLFVPKANVRVYWLLRSSSSSLKDRIYDAQKRIMIPEPLRDVSETGTMNGVYIFGPLVQSIRRYVDLHERWSEAHPVSPHLRNEIQRFRVFNYFSRPLRKVRIGIRKCLVWVRFRLKKLLDF